MDWPESAWDDPWSDSSDPRSLFLDLPQDPGFDFLDFGIYGDGGALPSGATSFCAQARAFGQADEYWNGGCQVSDAVAARLPLRYGSGPATIHAAELLSLLVGLRWCRPDNWNLLVFDRSSLFQVLRAYAEGSLQDLLRLSCAPAVPAASGAVP